MRKEILALLLALTGSLTVLSSAWAQQFPSKPITVIVPYTAGGPTDVPMRALAEAASKHLGQPIVIENKPGASGTLGPSTMAATAKPDGYTLTQMPATVTRLPLMQKTSWSANDFTYIINVSAYVYAMFTGADTPFKNWQDVVNYARKNPGKVTYGTPGNGSTQHLGTVMLSEKAGIDLLHVPYKGATEVNAAVVGGHVMLGASGTSVRPMVDAGKARFLNVWTDKRVSFLPDVPTLKDLGYPFVIEAPWGLSGPKGMDPVVVAKLHDAFKKALFEQPVIDALLRYDMKPAYMNSADYATSVAEQIKLDEALLGRLNLLKKP